jgi:hypothetical protein
MPKGGINPNIILDDIAKISSKIKLSEINDASAEKKIIKFFKYYISNISKC